MDDTEKLCRDPDAREMSTLSKMLSRGEEVVKRSTGIKENMHKLWEEVVGPNKIVSNDCKPENSVNKAPTNRIEKFRKLFEDIEDNLHAIEINISNLYKVVGK